MSRSPRSAEPGRPRPARRLLPYGDRAVLLECADLDDARALDRWLTDARPAPVAEVVPGARTLLLRLDADPSDPAVRRLTDRLVTLDPEPSAELPDERPGERPGERPDADLTIDVRYDGDDLGTVAAALGIAPAEVVARHAGQSWTVAFCGFAPGFGYLVGRDDLVVPRRASPRTRVPAGSVALADRWTGIYPRSAPGGWHLIGHTDVRIWDLGADPPALLRPGVRVRFRDRTPGAAAGPTSAGSSPGPVGR